MANCTCTPVNWLQTVGQELGIPSGGIIALLTTFASLGFFGFCALAPYCFRLCRGHDVITECRVGRSVVTLSIDSTGNGLHAERKLVFDMNARKVALHPTGGADSPADALPVRPESPGLPKKTRRVLSTLVANPIQLDTSLPPSSPNGASVGLPGRGTE